MKYILKSIRVILTFKFYGNYYNQASDGHTQYHYLPLDYNLRKQLFPHYFALTLRRFMDIGNLSTDQPK